MNMLLEPYTLNASLTLANRFVMAPMTRCMAAEGLLATPEMAAYYARRADMGLIISEAVLIRPDAQGYPNMPGIFTDEQISAWHAVTDAVHTRNGKIMAQLLHVGRVSHSYFHGQTPVAPSAIALEGTLPRMRELTYPVPRALTADDIVQLVEDFAVAAENAIAAGFDGVEIHGANGYLIDQFLHYDTNHRDDAYGQTPENMSRFVLEIIDAVSARIGGERVGLRLAPAAFVLIKPDARDRAVFDHLLYELDQRPLAYLHAAINDDTAEIDYLGGRVSDYLRARYHGTLIAVGNLTPEAAERAVDRGRFDLAAIGRPVLANPDYIDRLRSQAPLADFQDSMLATLY